MNRYLQLMSNVAPEIKELLGGLYAAGIFFNRRSDGYLCDLKKVEGGWIVRDLNGIMWRSKGENPDMEKFHEKFEIFTKRLDE